MLDDVLHRRPYNAVSDFVDANVARGFGDKIAFTDTRALAELRRAAGGFLPFRRGVAALGLREENRIILLFHDTVDYPVAFWGDDPRRHRSRYRSIRCSPPSNMPICSPTAAPPRRVVAGPLAPLCCRSATGCRICARSSWSERAARIRADIARRDVLRGSARRSRARTVHRADDVRRSRVLDVHVGLDRRSQGGQARSHQPDGDGAADGPRRHRHPRG